MIDLIGQFEWLKKNMEKLIKIQLTLGCFIEWQDWLEYEFNPLNEQYNHFYGLICEHYGSCYYPYIDYEKKIKSIILNDCDMKIYD